MMGDKKNEVPTFTMDLRVDDRTAVGTIKNRMRLLTLPGDRVEYDKLEAAKKEFEEWVAEKEKKDGSPIESGMTEVARATAR
jgi:hypothetical protein